jgi:hypothetical protein
MSNIKGFWILQGSKDALELFENLYLFLSVQREKINNCTIHFEFEKAAEVR